MPRTHHGVDDGGLTQISRFGTHASVLLLAILIPSLATAVQPSLHPQPTSYVEAAAPSIVRAGNVRLDASGVIAKRPTVPGESKFHRDPLTYYVQDGDTLGGIAGQFQISEDTLRWANPGLADINSLTLNQSLIVPPVDGVWLQVKDGDSVASLASRFHADPQKIVEFNLLRDPDHLQPGTNVMVPDGRGADYVPPAPPPAPAADPASSTNYGGGVYSRTRAPGGVGSWRFPWGQCTWYVSTRRFVPWSGNAWEWYGNAQAMGYSTGHRPQPGSIMVSWESPIGHVAYVESVHGDGSWTVSEMNYGGFGFVDYRTIYPGQISVIGFIY